MLKKGWLVLGLLPWLVGCIGGGSPPTRFYSLETSAMAPILARQSELTIGLGPISLPDSLERPQLLLRPAPYRRELAEFDHWIGDLHGEMLRALSVRLGALLGTERVFPYPWPEQRHTALQIRLEVTQFTGQLGGVVQLNGIWSLLNSDGTAELALAPFMLTQAVTGNDFPDLVAAMSALLEQLALQLAQAVLHQVQP